MTHPNLTSSSWSLASNTLRLNVERYEQMRNNDELKDYSASENPSSNSGETSNSSGKNATSHLTSIKPDTVSFGVPRAEENGELAAATR